MNAEPSEGTQDSWRQREQLLERFEQAWLRGETPNLADYLPADGAEHRSLLIELVRVDIEFRRKAGLPAQIEQYLETFPELREETTTAAAPALGDDELPERVGRYRVERKIDGGGMGIIARVHDEDFERPLAMKVLREGVRSEPGMAERFLREARLTGQLQHPGVPPVQEMGKLPDGRPYFIMKLIKGKSLATLLKERKADDLPRFLSMFEQICQTLAYAHSHGIIHRDLKPANIMVGAFGEVQVMDWGLAKLLAPVKAQPAPADNTRQQPSTVFSLTTPTVAGSETVAGTVIGTPAYMAPEQARGESETLDLRCDVFGLGGILCEILTGEPPFASGNVLDHQRQSMKGDLSDTFTRLDQAGADGELVELAKQCLAPEKKNRAPHAGAVAQAVVHYQTALQQRLKEAEIDRAAAIVKAEEEKKRLQVERKNRRAVLGLATSLVLLVSGGSAAALWYQNDQVRQETEVALRRAEADRKQALSEAAIRQALDQAGQTRGAVHAVLQKPGGVFELLNHPENWEAQLKIAQAALDRAKALFGNSEEGVEPELGRTAEKLQTLLAQDDRDRLLAVRLEKIRMDRATWVDGKFNFRRAAEEYPKAFAGAGLAITGENLAHVAARIAGSSIKEELVAALDDWAYVGGWLRTKRVPEQVLAVARQAAPDPQWGDRVRRIDIWRSQQALSELAKAAPAVGPSPQTLVLVGNLLEEGTALRETWLRQAQARYPGDFWLNLDLASALGESNPAEAAGYYWAAIAVRPGSSPAYNNLGNALGHQKKLPEAIAAYQKAIDLDPKFATAYISLGMALRDKKKLPEAIAAFQKAIDLDAKNTKAYLNLGVVLYDQKRLAEAIAVFQKAIDLDPKYAKAYNNLGVALKDQKKLAEAIAAYQKAIDLDPKFATAYIGLGNALKNQKKLPEAIAAYQKAIDLDPKYAKAYNNLGVALKDQKKLAEAIAAYQKAIDLDPKDAMAYNNLGNALGDQKKLPEAIAAYQKAIDLDQKNATACYNLGLTLYSQQKLPEAIAAYQKAIDLDPKYAEAHCNLGHAFKEEGNFPEALKSLQRGHTLGSQRPKWPYPSANWVRQCQELLAMEKRLPLVLGNEEPANPGELLALAQMCQLYKKRHASAARLYQEAFQAQPRLADDLGKPHRYNAACAAALAGCGQGDEAAKLMDGEKTKLRGQARDWLQADLESYTKLLKAGNVGAVMSVIQRLAHWQKDDDLAGLRDVKGLAKLPDEEKQASQKLWTDVQQLHKDAQSRFSETRLQGTLSAKETSQVHEIKMTAGKTYMIDMESKAFDTFLKLEDPQGKLLAENDDISETNQNSRIVFTAPADGAYRIVATSFQRRGIGPYTLTVREFKGNKK
jgi:tetratricopeptide (TPR) repeat protein